MSLPTLFELQCHHLGPITSMFLRDPESVICAILCFCLRCVHFVFLLTVSMWNRFSLSGFFLSALAKKMMLPIVYSMDSLFLSPEYGQYIYDSHSQEGFFWLKLLLLLANWRVHYKHLLIWIHKPNGGGKTLLCWLLW